MKGIARPTETTLSKIWKVVRLGAIPSSAVNTRPIPNSNPMRPPIIAAPAVMYTVCQMATPQP